MKRNHFDDASPTRSVSEGICFPSLTLRACVESASQTRSVSEGICFHSLALQACVEGASQARSASEGTCFHSLALRALSPEARSHTQFRPRPNQRSGSP